MKILPFQHHNIKKGILFVLLAWLCFSSLYAVSKLIEGQTTVSTMLFFRNILGILFILPWIIKGWPKSLKLNNPKIVLLRSTTGVLNLFFIFLAISKISLVNTTLLNNSAPFFVPFFVWFWLKKEINKKIWPAIVVGFMGIALILQPDARIFNLGAIYGLLSGVCLALTLITMRMTTRSEKLSTFMLYFFVFGAVVTAPFAAFSWKVANWQTLLGLLSIGLFSTLGQIFLYFGLKEGKAHQLAPFTYASVVFSGVYEWLIWGIVPPPIAYFGIVLIIGAGVWIVWTSRVRKIE